MSLLGGDTPVLGQRLEQLIALSSIEMECDPGLFLLHIDKLIIIPK